MRRLIFALAVVLLAAQTPSPFHIIPAQKLKLGTLAGARFTYETTIPAFEISNQVTYREYKDYLQSVKKDSGERYYLSQLPDSHMCAHDAWKKYINSSQFDHFPVPGVSWDDAMNYCRWKTLMENKDSIAFIYRLPLWSEWIAAWHYLDSIKTKSDFNKNYSDWLLVAKDESYYNFDNEQTGFPYDYIYLHKKNDPKVLKRKVVMGDSYLYQQQRLDDYYHFSYYADSGYRQVGFRLVKEPVKKGKGFCTALLNYWKLKK